MATGQFGRATTGSGSLASAISNLASDYANLRMDRIYQAFIDETTFEGQPMTAQNALSLLNDMIKNVSQDSKLYSDISKTMTDVRKSNRNRILNNFGDEEAAKGYGGFDYQKKIEAINQMLMDPTLAPSDSTTLKAELAKAYNDMFIAASNQFSNGDKFTINGQVIDFANGANADQFVGLFNAGIARNPEMADQIGKNRDIARAQALVAQGNGEYLKSARTTDAQKLAGKKAVLAKLKEALAILESSPYSLRDNAQTNQIRSDILDANDAISTLNDNIATIGTSNKLSAVYKDAFSYFDGVFKAASTYPDLVDAISQLTGTGNPSGEDILNTIATHPNEASQLFDLVRGRVGNSIKIDGKTIDLTPTGLYAAIAEHKNAMVALDQWASGNRFVSNGDKLNIAAFKDKALAAQGNQPTLKIEDAYDNAKIKLADALTSAGGNLSQRVAALRAFSSTLSGLAVTYNTSPFAKNLENEAYLYLTGHTKGANDVLYGDLSGNYGQPGSSGASEFGRLISPSTSTTQGQYSVVGALNSIYDDWKTFKAGGGTTYSDPITGEDVTVIGVADTSNYANGASMRLTSVDSIVGADGRGAADSILGTTTTDYRRYSIWDQNVLTNDSADQRKNSRVGWLTVYTDANGQKQYILTKTSSNGTSEQILSADQIDQFLPNGVTIRDFKKVGGEMGLIWGSDQVKTFRNDGKFSGSVNTTEIVNGSDKFYGFLRDQGITIIDDNQNAVNARLIKLFDSHQLRVDGSSVFMTDASGKEIQVSGYLSSTLLAQISTAYSGWRTQHHYGADGKPEQPYGTPTVPKPAPSVPTSGTLPMSNTTPTSAQTRDQYGGKDSTVPVKPPVISPGGGAPTKPHSVIPTRTTTGMESEGGSRPLRSVSGSPINKIGVTDQIGSAEHAYFFRNIPTGGATTGSVSSSTGRYVPGTRSTITRKTV